uniref:Uncharacterized protein n=1 Tax=Salix viminalis TaxID=40686 RepID=A0A6N2KV40_SALVM
MTVYVLIVSRIPSAKRLENSSFATSSFPAINMPSIRIVQRTISEPISECIERDGIRVNTKFEHLAQDRDSKMNKVQPTKAVNQYI